MFRVISLIWGIQVNAYVLDRSETGAFKAQLITRLGAYHFNTMETPVAEVAA